MIIAPLTSRPLLHICRNMRPRDQAECLVLNPEMPMPVWVNIMTGLPGDHFTFASDEGEPIAAGGWIEMEDPGVRGSWLVATAAIQRIGDGLHRFSVRFHDAMIKAGVRQFQTLGLDDGDERSTRWLLRLKYSRDHRTTITGAKGEKLAFWHRKAAHGQ